MWIRLGNLTGQGCVHDEHFFLAMGKSAIILMEPSGRSLRDPTVVFLPHISQACSGDLWTPGFHLCPVLCSLNSGWAADTFAMCSSAGM